LIKHFLKVAATLIALGLIYHTIDRDLFLKSIWYADIKFLLIAILLFVPIQFLSAYRWYFILCRLDQVVRFRTILHHSLLGQLSSLILPGQVSGDVVRLLSASRGQDEKVPIVLSIVIDKLALLLAVAIFTLVGVVAPGPVSHLRGVHLAALATITVCVPILLVLCRYRKDTRENVVMRFIGRSRFVRDCVFKTVGDFSALPRMRETEILNILSSALLLLCSYTVGAYFVALSMHIQINPVDWIAINAIVSFVQILPITIGGLGVREGAFGLILSPYGVSFSQSIVFSLTGFVLGAISTSVFWLALDLIEFEKSVSRFSQ